MVADVMLSAAPAAALTGCDAWAST